MVATRVDILTNRAVVVRAGRLIVRCTSSDGKTMFSCHDILAACGIKYPNRWKWQMEQKGYHFQTKKISFPSLKSGPCKRSSMVFIDADGARKLAKLTEVDPDVRQWFEDDVFPYKFDVISMFDIDEPIPDLQDGHGDNSLGCAESGPRGENEHEIGANCPRESTGEAPESIDRTAASFDVLAISRRIDSILYELLDIKRSISGPA